MLFTIRYACLWGSDLKDKRKILICALIIAIIAVLIVSLFFRQKPFGIAPISADRVYIEKLTGAGFSEDGELRNCYWVVTFTVDVSQSHFFILNPEFSNIGEVINEFEGQEVIPTSTINITFTPLEPYYAVKVNRRHIRVMPEIYDAICDNPGEPGYNIVPKNKHDSFYVDVYELVKPYEVKLHTPFKITVQKNGKVIHEKVIDVIGIDKQQFIVNDNFTIAETDEGIILATIGKLVSGISPEFGEFIYFGKKDSVPLALKRFTLDRKYIIDLFEYKEKFINELYYPNTYVPDFEAMGDLHYFKYWTGATSLAYVWSTYPAGGGWVSKDDPALGTVRPRLGAIDISGFDPVAYVYESDCDNYPAWTKTDKFEIWPHTYYASALYNSPGLIYDNSGTTPVGKSIYSWLVQDARAEVVDFNQLTNCKYVELVNDELRFYYYQGTVGWDLVQLRIPTELADTYVYGQYITKFEIDEQLSGWERTGLLEGVELIQGVPEKLSIIVRNVGNISAFAQLKCTPIEPSNLFSIIDLPTNILSDREIEPGTTYTFKLYVTLKGTPVTFDFSFEVSIWCEAEKQSSVIVRGKAIMSSAKLVIYTVGDNFMAKFWLDNKLLPRNKGTYFEGVFEPGTYTIKFEVLENFTAPEIYANEVHVGYESAEITLREGVTTTVKAIYRSATQQLVVEFVSWDDKGLFGLSPTFNPVSGKRVYLPQFHVVRLKVNVLARYGSVEGDLRIVILTNDDMIYQTAEYSLSLGSNVSRIYDCAFMLGSAESYHFRVEFDNVVVYYDPNTDTRAEVFVIPWYISDLAYLLGGVGAFSLIVLVIYLKIKKRGMYR